MSPRYSLSPVDPTSTYTRTTLFRAPFFTCMLRNLFQKSQQRQLCTYPFRLHWDVRLQQQCSSTGSCLLLQPEPRPTRARYLFRHAVFGSPGFLLPGGVHLRATLGILSLAILRTYPSNLNRRRLISRTALLQPVFLWSSMLDILLGQNIRQIFLKHPFWKASIFAMSPLITRQHSEPYSKIDFILLL